MYKCVDKNNKATYYLIHKFDDINLLTPIRKSVRLHLLFLCHSQFVLIFILRRLNGKERGA